MPCCDAPREFWWVTQKSGLVAQKSDRSRQAINITSEWNEHGNMPPRRPPPPSQASSFISCRRATSLPSREYQVSRRVQCDASVVPFRRLSPSLQNEIHLRKMYALARPPNLNMHAEPRESREKSETSNIWRAIQMCQKRRRIGCVIPHC